jgi:signal peptidase II
MHSTSLRALSAQSLRHSVLGRFVAATSVVAAIDLVSKAVAVRALGEHGVIPINDWFSLFVVYNTASAGSVHLGPLTAQINVLITCLAVGLIVSVVPALSAIDTRSTRALALVCGGAVGNLFSLLLGPDGVADFLAFRLGSDTTLVANVADFFLWSGAAMLAPVVMVLVRMVRAEREVKTRRNAMKLV